MKILPYSEYETFVKELTDLCDEIKNAKRPVYTQGSGDIFRNFRVGGLMIGDTPGHDLAHHMVKQMNAVTGLLTRPSIYDAEQATRFADLRNYTELGYAMWRAGIHTEGAKE